MTDYQLNALQNLADNASWQVVRDEILVPKIKDITEPYNETIKEMVVGNPAAAYIGRLMAVAILQDVIDSIDSQRSRETGKATDWK